MSQKLYDEAKQYALAALTPYFGQRFWHNGAMWMCVQVANTGISHGVWLQDCEAPYRREEMRISYRELWRRLNEGNLIQWRGNELRTSESNSLRNALTAQAV